MKNLLIPRLLNLSHTLAAPLLERYSYPWEVLPQIKSFIITLGATLDPKEYYSPSESVWISKDARVAPSALIAGPAIICPLADIRHCAFIRGGVIVGTGAVVGNSCELKNCILFDDAAAPHFNYIGDSILGHMAHMGAGAVTSNVKSDKSLVCINNGNQKIETGLKKFGAILGDASEIGCGSVLNPGSIIGKNSRVYPLTATRAVVPPNSILKSDGSISAIVD